LSASNIVTYMFFFAVYSATVAYGILYHRHDITLGLRDVWTSVKQWRPRLRKRRASGTEAELEEDINMLDVHNRLMRAYPEVPEWWYMICLAIAITLGMVGT